MSITNDKDLMTSAQLKRTLKSIHTDKIDVKNSLLNVVEQFQCMDHIAKSIGLLKDGFSFANKVSWKTVLPKLEQSDKSVAESEDINLQDIMETVSQSSSQLKNELIPQLRKSRNNWMLEVILIEFVLLSLLSLLIAGITHIQGLWSLSNTSISIQSFLYERPVFSFIMGILLFMSFIVIHFKIRNFVAAQLARTLNKESSEFDLAGAFLKNTRIQHSIFRPDIIGWGWLSRKCLLKNDNAVES